MLSHFIRAEAFTPTVDLNDPPIFFSNFYKFDGRSQYVTYPAALEREMDGGITRVWARKILLELEDYGILTHIDLRPPRRRDATPHYYLRRDHIAVSAIIGTLGKLIISDASLFRGLRRMIDENFVANVLMEKKFLMNRYLKLWSLGSEEIEYQFESLKSISKSSDDIRDLRDYLLQSLRFVYDDEVLDDVTAEYNVPMILPIMPADNLDFSQIYSLNPELNSDLDCVKITSTHMDRIVDHYRFHQRSHVVLPIIYMLAKSPSALLRFVLHPQFSEIVDKDGFSFDGTDVCNDLIFQLITATISDMASFGDDTGSSSHVALRPKMPKNGIDPLMIITDGTMDIFYDASFDTSLRRLNRNVGNDNSDTDNKSFLNVQTQMLVSPFSGLSMDDVLDFDRLIREMRRGKDSIFKTLLEALPNRFRNVIELLGPGVHWYDRLQSDLLLYLNLALMETDLLNQTADVSIKLSDEHIRNHEWAILNDRGFDGYELLRSNVNILRNLYPHIIRNRL